MARSEHVNVVGIREVRRELKQVDANLDPTLRKANRRIADVVAEAAQGTATGLGGVAAFVAPSITASGTPTGAAIRLGAGGSLTRKDGTSVRATAVAPGAEFGSDRYRQFGPWRGKSEGAGYFVYPTIRRMKPTIAILAKQEFDQMVEYQTH